MATKAKEGMVPIFLSKDANHKEPLTVIINGVEYKVERGKRVEIPPEVAEVIGNMMEQDLIAQGFAEAADEKVAKAESEGMM